MTTEADALLLKVAEDIADGKTVDWSRLSGEVDSATLARLRDIAALAGQFSAVGQVTDAAMQQLRIEPVSRLWAHLEVLDEIGRGSSGVVYRAFDPMLQRAVALKLCNPDNGRSDDLLREARQMAKVDHPGVLKIHGARCVDGQVGFWSDLVEGETVAARLQREQRIAAGEAIGIGREVCIALAAIHHADLVHGDVKAQNVVREAFGPHVLIDFGSARHSFDRVGISGTPLYLAPERLGDGATSQADDLYSLGVLMFRMLAGRFPVEGDSLAALAEAHREGARAHLLDLMPKLDPALCALVERAIDPLPERRFRSAGEFVTALNALLRDEPGVHPAIASTSLPKTSQHHRALAMTAIAIALAAALVVTNLTRTPAPASATNFQVQMLKTVHDGELPLHDGDRIAIGDALGLELELAEAAHVYVFNEDASGAVYQLFPLPLSEYANPLPAGRTIRLPGRVGGKALDWQVTSAGARERFYVLVAPQALPELGIDTTGFATAELGRPLDRSALVAAVPTVRGTGGLTANATASTATEWPTGAWLTQLQAHHPGTQLQKFELDNPR